ncbi:uncharacterized protein LOC100572273 [Acyrthosiphon pisum]|uniref:Uncharacterized protein n=1 Tax=Acyrthosiphon pisum TaxID=7029 RepID=A0A8R2AAV6_ACYPI|nr:uncharacterized protein LOC100572273 [Acyrthosiphon pisum]|eukprot:XP_003243721.1 PREDICTED: uncharacterized protein LOC100572273 [Acyrthosiphon pisum]
MSDHQQSAREDPLQRVAELLEMNRIQQTTGADPGRTTANIRNMPLYQLQRDPALWAAYIRGWDDKTTDVHKNLWLTQSLTYRQPSVLVPRPTRSETPAAHTRRAQPVTHAYGPPTTPHNTTITTTNTTVTGPQPAATASGLTKRQRRNKARFMEYMAKKKERAKAKASKQHDSPITPQPLTTFRDDRAVDGHSPAGSATTGHATDTSVPNPPETTAEEMVITPVEENEVLRGKTPEYTRKEDNDHDTSWWSMISAESFPKKKE